MKLISLIVLTFVAVINGGVVTRAGDLNWWKNAVFYQIYPRSFKDSNNDGTGDLNGIISKLEHFPNSGITAVWLSPIFESPGVDQGYDISNYMKVDPLFGTNEDLLKLIEEAHKLGIKVILDFVPNHTSDKHQWFIDSVNGVEEYRDYYLWANAKIDENGQRVPPNNWISVFKNSAWTWNEERQQYYFHQFAPAQPDLNYHNPAVVKAMDNVLKFWLDNGVDGFRIDAVPHIFEIEDLRDEPKSNVPGFNDTDYEYLDHIYTKDQPETYELVYSWRKLVDDYTTEHGGDQRVLMTECYTDTNKTMLYYGTTDGTTLGAHFAFNFNFITDLKETSTASDVIAAIKRWWDNIPIMYTSNWVLGNHDNHRAATRLGKDNVDGYNMLAAVLPGIQVTYNGEEIGQENGEVSYEEGQDPSARDPSIFDQVSRDFERTPYQWDTTVNAGFNEGAKTWLPVSEKYLETNLKDQQETDGLSHYKIYQALLSLRKENEILQNGNLHVSEIDGVLVVVRTIADKSIVLLFNIADSDVTINVEQIISVDNKVLITSINSNYNKGDSVSTIGVKLQGHESLIIATQLTN